MKKTLIITTLLALSTTAFAQSKKRRYKVAQRSYRYYKIKKKEKEPRSVELSISVGQSQLDEGEDEIRGSKAELSMAKIFFPNSLFSTSSGLFLRATKHNNRDMQITNGHSHSYEAGLFQRLSLNLGSSNSFSPYIKIGASKGRHVSRDEQNADGIDFNYKSEFEYFRISAATGFSVRFEGGFTPFIEVRRSKFQADSPVKMSGSLNGLAFNEEENLTGKDKRSYVNSLMIGFGYRF